MVDIDPIKQLRFAFRQRFGEAPRWIGQAPGRVNLIGEHTDYNDGFVLPIAIDRSTLVAAAPTDDPSSLVWSLDLGEENRFDSYLPERDEKHPWINYVRGVAWSFAQTGLHTPPLNLAVSSQVPLGTGLSSSAALEMSVAVVYAAAVGETLSPTDLALIAHRAESEFVGMPCGVMDQMISSLGSEGNALLIDCRTLSYERVPFELSRHGLALVVVDSGVSRSLAGSAYAERREECKMASALLKPLLPSSISALRDVAEADLHRLRNVLPELLFRRVRHVVSENGRVLRCVDALRSGRFDEVGSLLEESHRSLRDDFEVSCPELDLLVEIASRTRGVLGGRLTGAGFGGCTISLVQLSALDTFRTNVLGEYQAKTGRSPRTYICRAANGAKLI